MYPQYLVKVRLFTSMQNGNFKSLDDLKSVKGIGTAILDKNRDLLALE